MQEHIDWLQSTLEICEEHATPLINCLKLCISDAESKLEMEKVQIMETYYQALCDRFEHNLIPISFTRKEEVERFGIPYYEETFKSK